MNFYGSESGRDSHVLDAKDTKCLPFTVIGMIPKSEWPGPMRGLQFRGNITRPETPSQAAKHACREAARALLVAKISENSNHGQRN